MKKTYHGSCHCKRVTFEADLDLSQGTGKCNCSYCWKVRNWSVICKPTDFRLLSGEDDLTAYQFNTKANEHLFCKHCGVRSFTRGYIEAIGGAYCSVVLSALDDLDVAELVEAPLRHFNGRDNDWFTTPTEIRHL